MSEPLSALEYRTRDLIREVTPEAITFYVDGLSGLYLPDEFSAEHEDSYDVTSWSPERRKSGKFGRFVIRKLQPDTDPEHLDDILVMGTAIGLTGMDGSHMCSLRHYELSNGIRNILVARELMDEGVFMDGVDYGSTLIKTDDAGTADSLKVGSSSIDFGRADKDGRAETCRMFERLLGDSIEVINSDPEPREFDRIIK